MTVGGGAARGLSAGQPWFETGTSTNAPRLPQLPGALPAGSRIGSAEGRYVRWLTIKDQADSVAEDVCRIRAHPLVPRDIPIYGYVYDVETGAG